MPAIGNIHDVRNVKYYVRYRGRDGGSTDSALFFHVPRAWEFSLVPVTGGELCFYTDGNFSQPAENRVEPGDEDPTFRVTNAAG